MNARERSRIETRRRLIEKGTELFFERGFADARASDIARAAGVAVGTLYLHFKDKQGLLRAILFEGIEELLQSLRGLLEVPARSLADSIQLHTEMMVRFAEERPQLCRILFDAESLRIGISTEIYEYLASMQQDRLRDCVEAGLFPTDINMQVAAHVVVGMFVQVLDWWTRNPEKADRKEIIETISRVRLSWYNAGAAERSTLHG